MFLLDSLVIGGLRFVLDNIVAAADAENGDESELREKLLEAQMQLELGEITGEDFAQIERSILLRIREIKGSAPGAISIASGDRITGVDIESYLEED
jgi:hypothetical protein